MVVARDLLVAVVVVVVVVRVGRARADARALLVGEALTDGELDVVVSDDGELFGDGGCWSGDSGEWDLTFSGEVKWDGSFAGEMVAISEQTGEVQGIAQGSMDFEGPESGFEGWALYSLVEVDFARTRADD